MTRLGTLLAAAAMALLLGIAPCSAPAQDISGELVILQWLGGTEAEMWKKVEEAFMAKHPGVTVRELVVTGQGDMRGPMRTALMGGEVVDIIINTWPAFRAELIDAGILRPVDEEWETFAWSDKLGDFFPDHELRKVEKAGHFMMRERPDVVNQAIIEFCAKD